jgi:hypothetical protein
MIGISFDRVAGLALLIVLSSCGRIISPGSPPDDFSSGNFALTINASPSCTTLADAGRSRSWKIGLVTDGPSVTGAMEGWSDSAIVISQTTLGGTASGSSLQLTGYIYDTVDGCSMPLCYRAEGTITATQSGNVISGTLDGMLTYDQTTCAARDHQVRLMRQ